MGELSFMGYLLDPVVVRAAGAAVSVVLLIGALSKLKDNETFLYAVENYGFLQPTQAALFARVFPLFELLAGVALLLAGIREIGLLLGLVVLAVATGGVTTKLLQGHDRIECGCGLGGQRISWGLVVRNIVLVALMVLGAQEGATRVLTLLDYFSVAALVLVLLAVYASANQLLANQPLLKEIHS